MPSAFAHKNAAIMVAEESPGPEAGRYVHIFDVKLQSEAMEVRGCRSVLKTGEHELQLAHALSEVISYGFVHQPP